MKAWLGSMSDLYPLWGYHKRSYMALASVMGSIAICLLASWPLTHSVAILAPVFMFFASAQVATVDLLCEGKYAELMRQLPETKGDAISWVGYFFDIENFKVFCNTRNTIIGAWSFNTFGN